MDQSEFALQLNRTGKYHQLEGELEKFQLAIEDLKVPGGTLRIDVGGSRQTFQTFDFKDSERIRQAMIQALREIVHSAQCLMADI